MDTAKLCDTFKICTLRSIYLFSCYFRTRLAAQGDGIEKRYRYQTAEHNFVVCVIPTQFDISHS